MQTGEKKIRWLPKLSLGPYNKMVVYIYDGTQIMSVVKTIVKIGNLI